MQLSMLDGLRCEAGAAFFRLPLPRRSQSPVVNARSTALHRAAVPAPSESHIAPLAPIAPSAPTTNHIAPTESHIAPVAPVALDLGSRRAIQLSFAVPVRVRK